MKELAEQNEWNCKENKQQQKDIREIQGRVAAL